MGHHRFFPLTHPNHHTTPYNIYDQRWVSLSYKSDDMQRKIFICMKKSENGPLIEGVGDLMKMMDQGRGLGENDGSGSGTW
jgi:acetoacetate decarboxylase